MAYKRISPIPVVEGGTGAQTVTGVVIGNGTSAMTGNAVTQYNTLIGGASNAISSVAPSATSGVPLISQGSSSNPAYGTAVVAGGGTGATSLTAYAPVCGGTTSTGAVQSASTGISTSGFILTSTGSSSLPTFQAPAASSISITGNTGGALTGSSFTFTGGTTGLAFNGSGTTETLGGTLVVSNGGTGAATLTGVLIGNGTSAVTGNAVTQYNTLIGGASNAISSVAPSATSGVPLISQGSSSNPAYGTALVAGGGTGVTSFTAYAVICGGTTSTGVLQSIASVGSSGQILTSNGAGALPTFQAAPSSGVTWVDQTSSTVSMAVNTGYVIDNGASLVTATLPATAAVGKIVAIAGGSSGGWTVAQNSGQTIHFGSVNTTTGAGGSLSSSNRYDCVELICVITNTDWTVRSCMGNITYV